MTEKPTLSTVAREAGVSIPTVSQVMCMRSGENREIGFVINQLANPVNAEVVSGVVDLLANHCIASSYGQSVGAMSMPMVLTGQAVWSGVVFAMSVNPQENS